MHLSVKSVSFFVSKWTGYHLRSITLSPSVCKPLATRSWGLAVLRRRLPSPPSTRFYFSHLFLFFSLFLYPTSASSTPIYSFLLHIYFQPPFPFETSRKDARGIHKVRLSKVCIYVFSNCPITRRFRNHIRKIGKTSNSKKFIKKDRYLYVYHICLNFSANRDSLALFLIFADFILSVRKRLRFHISGAVL